MSPQSDDFPRRLRGRVETWIFDLDNTLYPPTPEASDENNRMLRTFIAGFLGVAEDEAHRLQKQYFQEFGLTLRGLMVHHGLDPVDYFEHMLQSDLTHIEPNPALAGALAALDGRRVIHTNACDRHVERVLERVGLTGMFEIVHDIVAAEYRAKPDAESYTALCRNHGIDASRAVMIDDLKHNLAPAAALGMTTVWLRNTPPADGAEEPPEPHIHHVTDDLVGWLIEAAAASDDPA